MRITQLFVITCLFAACAQKNVNPKNLRQAWLDSIIQESDSSFTRLHYREDLDKTVFYLNREDSTVTRLMKDSAGNTRQVIIMRKNTRILFAQYFPNGNIQADLPLDEFGQYHGTGNFYHENGKLQSTGEYNHGLKTGQWKVYDEAGRLLTTDSFDKDGQLIRQSHP
jgi:antitoxin component YwqK of YwqJK toxin-antitoxin module